MRVLLVHGHMFSARTWRRAQKMLQNDGIELVFAAQEDLAGQAAPAFDLAVAQLYQDPPGAEALRALLADVPHRLGLGTAFPPDFNTFGPSEAQVFARYLKQTSAENYASGIRYLADRAGFPTDYAPFRPLPVPGVFHPEAPDLFPDLAAYLDWRRKTGKEALTPGPSPRGRGVTLPPRPQGEGGRGVRADAPTVALLAWHGQIAEDNHADLDALIAALEAHDLRPLCVAIDSTPDRTLPPEKRYPWLPLVKSAAPEALLNCLASRLVNADDAALLRELDIPVIQAMRLYHQSPEEWRADHRATSTAGQLVFSLAQPEMNGVIEPTAAAAGLPERDPDTGAARRTSLPLAENIEVLCRRLQRRARLRRLPNAEKRLTIVLHNNPCKGVEATLGMAAGLDTFNSLAELIRGLRLSGYDTGTGPNRAPEDGETLLRLFLEKKAISEFRWTTADEIMAKGGVLHRTDRREYEALLAALPERARQRVLADWGEFPGEGMVHHEGGEAFLLVTGLSFGKLTLMIQPKRGCYGAKCDGEVCRILHDPELSPPPHWLASYAWIREHSDAVLHFGAHGSLEFLPGKQVALSPACFPSVSLDDLPNIYLYVLDLPSESTVAKRRGAAVLVSHLSPARRPVPLDAEWARLSDLAGQRLRALRHGEEARAASIARELEPLLQERGLQEQGESLDEALDLLERRLERLRREAVAPAQHRLGQAPAVEDRAVILAGMLDRVGGGVPTTEDVARMGCSSVPLALAAGPFPRGNVINFRRGGRRLWADAVVWAGSLLPRRFAAAPSRRGPHVYDAPLLRRAPTNGRRVAQTARRHKLANAAVLASTWSPLTEGAGREAAGGVTDSRHADLPASRQRRRLRRFVTSNPVPATYKGAYHRRRPGVRAPFSAAVQTLAAILRGAPDPALAATAPGRRLIAWCKETDALLLETRREIPQLLHALDGGHLEAGLSASLLLGKTAALPSGRNLYPADVRALPTRAAWEAGRRLADRLLLRHLADEGRFPDSVGVSLWSLDAFKSDGEVFCQILHLMGMRPEWKTNGEVARISAQPLESLVVEVDGAPRPRPRVDVLVQTSGLVRDLLPHFMRLLDEAACLAGDLDEPPEWNRVRKHTLENMAALSAELEEKLPEAELRRLASFRVFSRAPGSQGGADIGLALDASAWNSPQDLAEIHVNAQGFAYGAGASGRAAHSLFARALSRLDVSYQRRYSPEYGLLDSGGAATSLGGMALAARTLSGGRSRRVYWGESSLERDPDILNLADELNRQAHAKLLNREWIAAQKAAATESPGQGYQRVGAVSGMVNALFHWSATADVDSRLFDGVADRYLADADTLSWLRTNNPHALEEITRRLLEAQARGLWQADEARLSLVREAALAIEGDMEEGMGEVNAEFQGGKVDIRTADAVDKWRLKWRLPDQAGA